jgi:tRNA (guanine37-N1)-methyltransferase
MIVDVVTLFPGAFLGPLGEGILARARRVGMVSFRLHDLRRWGVGTHREVDDAPFGGGGGMVLKPEPFFEAVDWIRERYPAARDRVVLLSPQGGQLGHDVSPRSTGLSCCAADTRASMSACGRGWRMRS